MFDGLEKIAKTIALLVLFAVLGLCGWIWHQSNKIDDLRAENQAQAQIIQEQERVNQSLQKTIELERQAVIEQQRQNEEIDKVAIENAKSVKTIIKTQPCASARLPQPVIDRLHK